MQQEQTSSTAERSDTTGIVVKHIQTEMIPGSKVNLTVSVDSLLKLPEGAVFRESKDRAHIEAKQKGGVIYITGTCDSLQRQVEYYEALYHTARDALEQKQNELIQERQKRSDPLADPILIYVLGIVSGVLVTITFNLKKKEK